MPPRTQPGNYANVQAGRFLEGALLGRPNRAILESFLGNKRFELRKLMAGIRLSHGPDYKPDNPERPFLNNLVFDLADQLYEEYNIDPNDYEVRVYSALETPLDANGVDFWLELVDLSNGQVLSDYKVDLTLNIEKVIPGGLADVVYHYDESLDDQGGLDKVREGVDYRALVESAAKNLFQRAGLKKLH